MANEFDDMEEEVPEQVFTEPPKGKSIAQEFDFNDASSNIPVPARIDLDGKTVEIIDAKIYMPKPTDEWIKSRDKLKEYKRCQFRIYYSIGGQQEFYSGCTVFKQPDGSLSAPSIARDGKTQASVLFNKYAEYKKKDMKEVSLKEFLSFLKTKPKAIIKVEEVENPTNKQIIKKNMVGKFIA
jgi:hypothetical protein